jgi:anti-sigma regulatory factor (Ser/Thr protein kinase)
MRMAVDEACTQLTRHANQPATMRVSFHLEASGCLRVAVSVPTNPEQPPIDTGGWEAGGFGWRVLGTLTDELVLEQTTGPNGEQTSIRFTCRPQHTHLKV